MTNNKPINYDIEQLLVRRTSRLNVNAKLAGTTHIKSVKIGTSITLTTTNAKVIAIIIAMLVDPDSVSRENLQVLHLAVAIAIEDAGFSLIDYDCINLQFKGKTFKVLHD